MEKISSTAIYAAGRAKRDLEEKKENVRTAFYQIKDGQEKLENALNALGLLGEANISKPEEKISLSSAEIDKGAEAKTKENIKKAKSIYEARLKNEITLQSRASAFANLSGDMPSETRYGQLMALSDEQLAALDDITLKSILAKNTKNEIKETEWLKTLTPEEIIIIQEMPMGRKMLENILEGNFDSPEELDQLLDTINKGIEKYS